MAQIVGDIPDEDREWMRARVTADISIASQVREAIAEYRKYSTRKEREAESVVNAQHG